MDSLDHEGVDAQVAAALRDILPERWEALERACARAEGASGGWTTPTPRPDGTVPFPVAHLDPDAQGLLDELYPLLVPFDWRSWSAGHQLLDRDLDALAEVTPVVAVKLVTTLIRADRSTEGTLLGAFESGVMTTLVTCILRARDAG